MAGRACAVRTVPRSWSGFSDAITRPNNGKERAIAQNRSDRALGCPLVATPAKPGGYQFITGIIKATNSFVTFPAEFLFTRGYVDDRTVLD